MRGTTRDNCHCQACAHFLTSLKDHQSARLLLLSRKMLRASIRLLDVSSRTDGERNRYLSSWPPVKREPRLEQRRAGVPHLVQPSPHLGNVHSNQSWRDQQQAKLEFAILRCSRTLNPRSWRKLTYLITVHLLAIEWKGPIAYRVGFTSIAMSEDEWQELEQTSQN